MLPGLTVVVSPLISLMKDQVDALSARGLPAAFINSTLTGSQVSDRLARAGRGDIKMLYVAPERFDSGATAERLRAWVSRCWQSMKRIASASGATTFGRAICACAPSASELGAPPTIALTATATPEVRKDIALSSRFEIPTIIVTGFDRTNLHYHVLPTRNDAEKDDALVQTLRENEGSRSSTPRRDATSSESRGVLERARVSATAYHAGLDDAHRHEVQDSFMNETVRAIVATNAFGMGIDKPNVRLVVHHAMPGTLEAYYQEAGRAGRDGLHSECVCSTRFRIGSRTSSSSRARIRSAHSWRLSTTPMRRVVDASGMTDLGPRGDFAPRSG